MVRRGDFELRLVDATTKQPLIEYEKDGEIWVVGRPGAEFFLESTSWRDTNSRANITIDGHDIGYAWTYTPDQATERFLHGARQQDGDQTALRFATVPPATEGLSGGTGSVVMTWTAATVTDIPLDVHVFGKWAGSALVGATSAGSKKEAVGALTSTLGTTSAIGTTRSTQWHSIGPPLQTITMRYCEEAGLVVRKIITLPASANSKKRAGDPIGTGKGKKKATVVVDVDDDDDDAAGPADVKKEPAIIDVDQDEDTGPNASWSGDEVAAWLRVRKVSATALAAFEGLDGEELMALDQGRLW